MDALNIVFDVKEDGRSFCRIRLTAILLTIGLAGFVILSLALVLYGDPCWWCDRPPAAPLAIEALPVDTPICRRCGQELWARDNVEQS